MLHLQVIILLSEQGFVTQYHVNLQQSEVDVVTQYQVNILLLEEVRVIP